MSNPRDHHFIPAFYLKQWAPAGKLIEYTIKHGRLIAKPVGPRATAYQRDLYTFPDLPPDLATFLENVFLKQADSLACVALHKLLSGDNSSWTSQSRSAWSRFLINFLIRHPDPFAELRAAAHGEWLKPHAQTQALYEQIRLPGDPRTFVEYSQSLPAAAQSKIHIRLLQALMDNERVGTRINNMHWTVLNLSRSDDALLTSDWPLDKNLGSKNGFLSLPVGPRSLFVGVDNPQVVEKLRETPPKKIVHRSNKIVVTRARRFVYASDTRQSAFIKKHFSTRMIQPPFFPTVSGLKSAT